ncbi:MAG TPA: hypothetical protein VN922_17505 [Bacteroidia bacterium]|nr:hypothetical protein [Bacteroidia bacterium]
MSSSLQQHHQQHDVPYLKNILDDDSLTFAEKAISVKSVRTKSDRGSSKSKITSLTGEIVVVDVDLAMAQDSTGPLAIRSLNEMGIDKLYDPSKVLVIIDHTFPAADEKVANLHALIRDFVSKHNCMLVEGSISHQYMIQVTCVPDITKKM